jgi:hypothetical protein
MSAELTPELLEVEALLRRTANAFAYPRTPSLTAAVSARLREREPAAPVERLAGLWRQPALRLAVTAAAALLIAVGAALAVPQSRDALARFFGLSHVRVEVAPRAGPTPPVLSPESFARPATLAQVRLLVDFPLRFPTRDGTILLPDATYVQGEDADLPVVIFVYENDDFDLYQTRLAYLAKGVAEEDLLAEIVVGDDPAYWIAGGHHIASFLDEQGRVVVASERTVERATLLWEEDGITYRLETSLSQAEAIRVAESLR